MAQLLGGGEQRDPVGSGWARGGACTGQLPCPGGPCPGCVALAGGHQAGHGPAAAPPERLRGAWGSLSHRGTVLGSTERGSAASPHLSHPVFSPAWWFQGMTASGGV